MFRRTSIWSFCFDITKRNGCLGLFPTDTFSVAIVTSNIDEIVRKYCTSIYLFTYYVYLSFTADSSTPEESILSQHRTSFVSDDGSQSVTMKNLAPRTTYQISVSASNDIGTSHASELINVTTKVDREYFFCYPL